MKLFFLLLIFKLANSAVEVEKSRKSRIVNVDLVAYNGFPFGIMCGQNQEYEYYYHDECMYDDCADPKKEVMCVITKNGEPLFDETFAAKNLFTKGIFEIADESWNGQKISIVVHNVNESESENFAVTVRVVNPVEQNCSEVQKNIRRRSEYIGQYLSIGCFAPEGMHMSESQFHSITPVWYHGCTRIERDDQHYKYEKVRFHGGDYIDFGYLLIRDASFSKTPGKYQCVLEREGARLPTSAIQVCLREQSELNLPVITADQKKYKVTPGGSITATCSGQTGTKANSLSQVVMWLKHEDKNGSDYSMRKCFDVLARSRKNRDCSSKLPGRQVCCDQLTAAQIDEMKNHKLNDTFTASYTLRNVTEADRGLYTCVLRTTRGSFFSNFSILVDSKPSMLVDSKPSNLVDSKPGNLVDGKPTRMAIALTIRDPAAKIAYIDDVFNDLEENSDRYPKQVNHLVYHSADQTGDRFVLADDDKASMTRKLEQCTMVVLFVTPKLLDDHEIVDDELYDLLRQLNSSIETSHKKVIFSLSEETKEKINAQEANGNKASAMLSELMKKGEVTTVEGKRKSKKEILRDYTGSQKEQETESSVVCSLIVSYFMKK